MCNNGFMNVKTRLRRWFYILIDFRATPIPVGLTQFNEWADRLLFTYFPPGITPPAEDSFRFSLAAMVLHLDSQADKKPNRFFGKAIYKGAANEVASYVMHELKAKRDALIAQQEAEILRQKLAETPTQTKAEATAPMALCVQH